MIQCAQNDRRNYGLGLGHSLQDHPDFDCKIASHGRLSQWKGDGFPRKTARRVYPNMRVERLLRAPLPGDCGADQRRPDGRAPSDCLAG